MSRKPDAPIPACSFCGRTEDLVDKLISGREGVYICDHCVRLSTSIITSTATQKRPLPEQGGASVKGLLKPRALKNRLDEYIVGQDVAKKVISVAVYNHYKRLACQENPFPDVELNKSNVLLFGPTGSGKTLIARTLATILNVPFAIADATTLTEAGYVGEDVESILTRLIQNADHDVSKAERGIIYIDEVDKIHRTTSNVSITRDVSGEGVQQALLKIIEGTVATIPPRGGRKHPHEDQLKINTDNILFIAGGAFVGLEKIIAKRLGKATIGFTSGDTQIVSHERNALLARVEPEDFIAFGMIPEFVGRFNSIANCNELSLDDLLIILTQPKNAVIKQFQALFSMENVRLDFTSEALHAIAKKAHASTTGARALRMILENLMRDLMFEVPTDDSISEIVVTQATVEGLEPPRVIRAEKAA